MKRKEYYKKNRTKILERIKNKKLNEKNELKTFKILFYLSFLTNIFLILILT